MGNETDEFVKYLASKVRQYRLEALAEFTTIPTLLMGDGLRSFELLSLFIPTLQIGPAGFPVPGGTFSDINNVIRYPVAANLGQDIMRGLDTRQRGPNDTYVTGERIIDDDEELLSWRSNDVSVALVAGAGDVTLVDAALSPNNRVQVKINRIGVLPIVSPGAIQLLLTPIDSGAGSLGQNSTDSISYLFNVGLNIRGEFCINYPDGKRFETGDVARDAQLNVINGAGAEVIYVNFNWRLLP